MPTKMNHVKLNPNVTLRQVVAGVLLVLSFILFLTGWATVGDSSDRRDLKRSARQMIEELEEYKDDMDDLQDRLDREGIDVKAKTFYRDVIGFMKTFKDGAISVGELGKICRVGGKYADAADSITYWMDLSDYSGALKAGGVIFTLLFIGVIALFLLALYLGYMRKGTAPIPYTAAILISFVLMGLLILAANSELESYTNDALFHYTATAVLSLLTAIAGCVCWFAVPAKELFTAAAGAPQGGYQPGRNYSGAPQGGYQPGNYSGAPQGGYQPGNYGGAAQGGYQPGNYGAPQGGYQPGGYGGAPQGGYQPGNYGGAPQGGYQPGGYGGAAQGGYQPGNYGGAAQGGYQPGNYGGAAQGGYQPGNYGAPQGGYQPGGYGSAPQGGYQPGNYGAPQGSYNAPQGGYQPGGYSGAPQNGNAPAPAENASSGASDLDDKTLFVGQDL